MMHQNMFSNMEWVRPTKLDRPSEVSASTPGPKDEMKQGEEMMEEIENREEKNESMGKKVCHQECSS